MAVPYPAEAKIVSAYDEAAWSGWTCEVLRHGVKRHAADGFVAWPDTGRAWADHLGRDHARFLNQFLPPV